MKQPEHSTFGSGNAHHAKEDRSPAHAVALAAPSIEAELLLAAGAQNMVDSVHAFHLFELSFMNPCILPSSTESSVSNFPGAARAILASMVGYGARKTYGG